MTMVSSLDDRILAAAENAAAAQNAWKQKHIPIRVNGNTVWVSTDIPAELRNVLDVLPKEKDAEPVKRPHQIKSRLSDDELEAFDALLTASGLSQTDYIRGMVLHGRVNITHTSAVDAQALDALTTVSGNLGKIAGMIRQTVIVNKEFAVLTPESKDRLEAQLRALRQLQTYIQRLAEALHGHLQA